MLYSGCLQGNGLPVVARTCFEKLDLLLMKKKAVVFARLDQMGDRFGLGNCCLLSCFLDFCWACNHSQCGRLSLPNAVCGQLGITSKYSKEETFNSKYAALLTYLHCKLQ